MSMNTSIRHAVRCALFAGTVSVVSATLSLAANAAESEITEVVVTGSRIARPEIEASTPVQVINSAAIAEQGAPNIADILQELYGDRKSVV